MNVLTITGDRSFKAGNPRFDLQAEAVKRLEALYWGPGALWPHVAGDSFDVVSTQDPFFRGLLGLFLARHFKASLNVQVHVDLAAQGPVKRALARFVLARADSIRVVSERLKAQVDRHRQRGHRMSTLTVLPIFIDSERFKKIERKPDAQPTILWIGRFENEKDPLLALRVFRQVREKGIDAKLIMLGSGSLEGRLRRSARGAPVEFPGWQDTAPFLARASVVLSTSRAESYGASIIEALAAGVPVVAPDVGIAKEAGATVVPMEHLSDALIEILLLNKTGSLMLQILSQQEWQGAWRASLEQRSAVV